MTRDYLRDAQEHLRKNKMGYGEHFNFAAGHGIGCIVAGIYLLIHAVLPCFYRQAGSRLVHELEIDFVEHRKRS